MGLDIKGWIAEGGYVAIAALMFLENLFPPIPSEIIMPLAGYAAAREGSELTFLGVVAAGSFGSYLGALFWYLVGRWVGTDRLRDWARRHGRWITMKPSDVDSADRWFDRWGFLAVLLGRMVPTVRTLISIPAGMSEMPFVTFSIFTLIGTVAFTTLLAAGGVLLERGPDMVSALLGPVSTTVIVVIALVYVYRLVTFDRRREGARSR